MVAIGVLGMDATLQAAEDAAPFSPVLAVDMSARVDATAAELSELEARIADEKLPMARTLARLERELGDARNAYQEVKKQLDRRTLDMTNVRKEIEAREQESSYLSTLLGEYIRNFETRLHISELAAYRLGMDAARLAPENSNMTPEAVFKVQAQMVDESLSRLQDLLGGARFLGRAAGEDGLVKEGTFVLLGPVSFFASDDGELAGLAAQRLGSVEPSVIGFANPAYLPMCRALVRAQSGEMPFDSSLGNARKAEETKQTLKEHMMAGGPVMLPILGLAGASLLVALYKWVALSCVFLPSRRRLARVTEAVRLDDRARAGEIVAKLRGPAGRMLRAGVAQLGEPKDLIEEVMFEKLLETRFKLNKALPFVAVSAACAPLLGLLGTVTGIINTFKLITVFGSGDVKMLSGGISEALITTEFGLIIAIPTILFHAFLSRKAKTIVDKMERMAIGLLTDIEKAKSVRSRA